MRIGSVSVSRHDDGKRSLEVFATGNLFRYAIDVWKVWPADHPVAEDTEGYWSEQYCSGFFDSADAARNDALAIHFGSEVQT
jgi:hypothetical protein